MGGDVRNHLSSETIDLLLLAALDASEANAARAHLDDCAHCRGRWQELTADKQRFEQFVFPRTLPRVEARVAASRAGLFERFKVKLLLPAVGLAAALGVVALTGPGTQTEDDLYVGIKGQPTLEVYAARGNSEAFAVTPGLRLQPADRIRFVVNPAGAKHLLIASRDGAGVFSVYHPFGGETSQPVAGGQVKLELPGSVELDATLGAEVVVAAFSDEPLRAEAVKQALEAGGKAPKLPGVRFVTLEFVKVAP
jgi:hypothetical protein